MPKKELPPAPAPVAAVEVIDAAHAPVIYFDGAPNFGASHGLVTVTLAFVRHLASSQSVHTDVVATAHLRCSIQAAKDLRAALDNAILLAAPSGSEPATSH